MVGLEDEIPDVQERVNHILTKQLFGLALTELTSMLSRRSVYCSKDAVGEYSVCNSFDGEGGNIFLENVQHKWVNGRCYYCPARQDKYDRGNDLESYAYQFIHDSIPKEIAKMNFDVIVGNPPYQLSDGGGPAGAMPIYHKFILQAKKLNPNFLAMIVPSRWFSGGRGLDSFRKEMLEDDRIKVIHDFVDAKDCFQGVEIKGGVNYFLWDKNNPGNCRIFNHLADGDVSEAVRPLLEEGLDFFIRNNKAIAIYRKVSKSLETPFSSFVSSQKPFGLRTFFKGSEIKRKGYIKVYRNKGVGYASISDIPKNHDWITKYKVLVPRAVGSGDTRTDVFKPIISEPGSCCSETYTVIGPFDTEREANNAAEYVKTSFFHFMVGVLKNTQMAPKSVYKLLPALDFREQWTDVKLYKKYRLTKSEIESIESMVRVIQN